MRGSGWRWTFKDQFCFKRIREPCGQAKPTTEMLLRSRRRRQDRSCDRTQPFAPALRPNAFPLHDVINGRRTSEDRGRISRRPSAAAIKLVLSDKPSKPSPRSLRRNRRLRGHPFSDLRLSPIGGARRDRTDDLMLAKHALSQLSYGPIFRQKRTSRQLGVAFAPSEPSRSHELVSPRSSTRKRRPATTTQAVRLLNAAPTARLAGVLPPLWLFEAVPKVWWAWEDLNLRPHAYQARALTN